MRDNWRKLYLITSCRHDDISVKVCYNHYTNTRKIPVIRGDFRRHFALKRSGVPKQLFWALDVVLVSAFDSPCVAASLECCGVILSDIRLSVVDISSFVDTPTVDRSLPISCQRKSPSRGSAFTKSKFHRRFFSSAIRFNSESNSARSCAWSMGPKRFRQQERLIPNSKHCCDSIEDCLTTLATLITQKSKENVSKMQ